MVKRLIVGITGATGAIYGVRLLDALKQAEVETHLVLSNWGARTIEHETGLTLPALQERATVVHGTGNMAATISSGSFRTDGMIVAPCSMRTAAAIAHGNGDNLVHRAADVVLKERRRLVLVPRETPLNLAHLRNMVAVTEMGGIIMPPMPAFYAMPKTLDDLVQHTVGRILDLFGVRTTRVRRWQGLKGSPAAPD
jgi:polyprenyl P-hydroxybenzoate/phenylacrylic acid decarboxylase-like protein